MQIYTLLGIQPTATEAEIKKAYRKLALKYHPDKNEGNAQAQVKFVAINKAYQLAIKNAQIVKYKPKASVKPNNYSQTRYSNNKSSNSNSSTGTYKARTTTGKNKQSTAQQDYSKANKSSQHYQYKHTYYDFHKKEQTWEREEFDWDKYYNKYSNVNTEKKTKPGGDTQYKTTEKQRQKATQKQAKQTVIVEEDGADFTQAVLYAIAVLIGILVFVVFENTMWGITVSLVVASLILLSNLMHTDESVSH